MYVTHDQVEAMTLATRIAVMSAGRLQQVGRPHEVYDQPANLFVAGFMGAPAMNLIEATLVRDQGRVAVRVALADGSPAPMPSRGCGPRPCHRSERCFGSRST